MKTKRLLAIIMVVAISMCLFVMPSSAADEAEPAHTHIEVYFEDENLSDEFKEKATAHFLNGAPEDDGTATYGLTCTLFGHKLETTTTYTITHKARATAPRCLKRYYDYSACTMYVLFQNDLLCATDIYSGTGCCEA